MLLDKSRSRFSNQVKDVCHNSKVANQRIVIVQAAQSIHPPLPEEDISPLQLRVYLQSQSAGEPDHRVVPEAHENKGGNCQVWGDTTPMGCQKMLSSSFKTSYIDGKQYVKTTSASPLHSVTPPPQVTSVRRAKAPLPNNLVFGGHRVLEVKVGLVYDSLSTGEKGQRGQRGLGGTI